MTAIVELSEYERSHGKPAPDYRHSVVQGELLFALNNTYRKHYSALSELTIRFGDKKYTPDISIYAKRGVDYQHVVKDFAEPPLTAIEIMSPSQTMETFEEKFDAYFAAGVKSCWFVQSYFETIFVLLPNRNVSVFHANTLTDPTKGISLDLTQVFGTNP
jgi:Uma2 family endonuclease